MLSPCAEDTRSTPAISSCVTCCIEPMAYFLAQMEWYYHGSISIHLRHIEEQFPR